MTLRLFIAIISIICFTNFSFTLLEGHNRHFFKVNDHYFDIQDSLVNLVENISIDSEPYFLKKKGFRTAYKVKERSRYALSINYSNEILSSHKGILFVQFGHKIIVKQHVDLQIQSPQKIYVDLGRLDAREFEIGTYFVSKEESGKIQLHEINLIKLVSE